MDRLNPEIPEEHDGEERATDKQKSLIRALYSEVGAGSFAKDALDDLAKSRASAIIEQLQDFKEQLNRDRQSSPKRGEWPLVAGVEVAIVIVVVIYLVLSKCS